MRLGRPSHRRFALKSATPQSRRPAERVLATTATRNRTARRRILLREDPAPLLRVQGRVDKANGNHRHCQKLLGQVSKNTHGVRGVDETRYTDEAMREAVSAYEGLPSNFDPCPPVPTRGGPASADRGGKIFGVTYKPGSGIYGNLRLLKSHPMTDRLLEAASDPQMSNLFACSHHWQGATVVQGRTLLVTRIIQPHSVDIVTAGGTVAGLYEARKMVPASQARKHRKKKLKKRYRLAESTRPLPVVKSLLRRNIAMEKKLRRLEEARPATPPARPRPAGARRTSTALARPLLLCGSGADSDQRMVPNRRHVRHNEGVFPMSTLMTAAPESIDAVVPANIPRASIGVTVSHEEVAQRRWFHQRLVISRPVTAAQRAAAHEAAIRNSVAADMRGVEAAGLRVRPISDPAAGVEIATRPGDEAPAHILRRKRTRAGDRIAERCRSRPRHRSSRIRDREASRGRGPPGRTSPHSWRPDRRGTTRDVHRVESRDRRRAGPHRRGVDRGRKRRGRPILAAVDFDAAATLERVSEPAFRRQRKRDSSRSARRCADPCDCRGLPSGLKSSVLDLTTPKSGRKRRMAWMPMLTTIQETLIGYLLPREPCGPPAAKPG